MTWDIFCTVIDNYGDIGVTWRLARQLATEHHIPVRLWVDDLAAFRHICPEIDPALDRQCLGGVEVRRWTDPLPEVMPGEMVIEALACNLPDTFVDRMAVRRPQPLWLNLEYLTAEDWAQGVHQLPSPHPRLPITKYFFMPGYLATTGGLTRERDLTRERLAFQATPGKRDAFWQQLSLPPARSGELQVSLFSYENQALPSLLSAWSEDLEPVRVLLPVGKALPQIAAWFATSDLRPGSIVQRGNLTLHVLPMLDQDNYDRLLWACDLNLVRGEDSFTRAQFAARPVIWQAYRQDEAAHLAKVESFLDLYCAAMDSGLADLVRKTWRHWNRELAMDALWPAWRSALPMLERHARAWDAGLATQPDLVSNLLIFFKEKVECAAFP